MTARTSRCSSMVIALTGFMGCGKSSVGRELSTLLGIPLIDLDQYIEKKTGRSIPDIFAQDGETAFRVVKQDGTVVKDWSFLFFSPVIKGFLTSEKTLSHR